MIKKIVDRFQQFREECKVINLQQEYSGYHGEEQWAIVTEHSRKELLEKYPAYQEPERELLEYINHQIDKEKNNVTDFTDHAA